MDIKIFYPVKLKQKTVASVQIFWGLELSGVKFIESNQDCWLLSIGQSSLSSLSSSSWMLKVCSGWLVELSTNPCEFSQCPKKDPLRAFTWQRSWKPCVSCDLSWHRFQLCCCESISGCFQQGEGLFRHSPGLQALWISMMKFRL